MPKSSTMGMKFGLNKLSCFQRAHEEPTPSLLAELQGFLDRTNVVVASEDELQKAMMKI